MIERFSNGEFAKNVKTVGEMIDELSRLPRGLPVRASFEDSADLVVFNVAVGDRHLSVEDGGLFDEGATES